MQGTLMYSKSRNLPTFILSTSVLNSNVVSSYGFKTDGTIVFRDSVYVKPGT